MNIVVLIHVFMFQVWTFKNTHLSIDPHDEGLVVVPLSTWRCMAQFPTEVESLTGNHSLDVNTLAATRLRNDVSDEKCAGKDCFARVEMGLGSV